MYILELENRVLLQIQTKDKTRLPSEAESDGVEVLQKGAGDLLQAADELAHPRPGRHAVARRLWESYLNDVHTEVVTLSADNNTKSWSV